jgi:hypothetical protein
MNFSIPFGAGQDAINAVVQRGIDAMYEQEAAGETADVAFLFEGRAEGSEEEGEEWDGSEEEEGEEWDDDEQNAGNVVEEKVVEDRNSEDRNDEHVDNHTISIEDWANDKEEEFVAVCEFCGEETCLFEQNKETLVAFDEVEQIAAEEIPSNNIRRKRLYRQLTLILNGGPMGAGVRRELPACCVAGIRAMHPSESFMGCMPEQTVALTFQTKTCQKHQNVETGFIVHRHQWQPSRLG